MIPLLYSSAKGAPVITGMGMGPLVDCIECTCYEQINGEFECTLKYPCTGSLFSYIREGAIIVAKPSPAYERNYQQFVVYKISEPISGIITVNAHHVSYELAGLPVLPFYFNEATPDVIMEELHKNTLIADDRFVFSSKLTNTISVSSKIPKNLREVFLGSEASIASSSNNEFFFDNYKVFLLESRGQSTEVEIIYGRDLVDYNQERSIENAYSHLVAYAITKNIYDEEVLVTTSPEAIQLIDPVILGHRKCLIRDFTSEFDDTADVNIITLDRKVNDFIKKNNLSVPSINFRVSFIDLKKNSENKDIVSAFGNIGLGDDIKVLIYKLGISAKARIIATRYNVLAEEFVDVEIGARRENVADTIYKLQKNNKTVARSVSSLQENNKHIADYPVEVGEKDGWHYKKWASGDVECWRGKTSNTLCEWDSSSVVGSVQLPFDFVGTIWPFCSGYQEGVSSSAINMVAVDSSNKAVSAYMSINKNQYDQGKYCRFNFLVKGRWK